MAEFRRIIRMRTPLTPEDEAYQRGFDQGVREAAKAAEEGFERLSNDIHKLERENERLNARVSRLKIRTQDVSLEEALEEEGEIPTCVDCCHWIGRGGGHCNLKLVPMPWRTAQCEHARADVPDDDEEMDDSLLCANCRNFSTDGVDQRPGPDINGVCLNHDRTPHLATDLACSDHMEEEDDEVPEEDEDSEDIEDEEDFVTCGECQNWTRNRVTASSPTVRRRQLRYGQCSVHHIVFSQDDGRATSCQHFEETS